MDNKKMNDRMKEFALYAEVNKVAIRDNEYIKALKNIQNECKKCIKKLTRAVEFLNLNTIEKELGECRDMLQAANEEMEKQEIYWCKLYTNPNFKEDRDMVYEELKSTEQALERATALVQDSLEESL